MKLVVSTSPLMCYFFYMPADCLAW